MTKPEPLQYGQYYPIYNRGNNSEALFREERNYRYFLNCTPNTSSRLPKRTPIVN
jgi:hypothetical protein